MEIDKKIIKKLVEALEELKISLKDEIFINDNNQIEEEIEISKAVVKSPIVGTAYLASEPGATHFIAVGKKIKKADLKKFAFFLRKALRNIIPKSYDSFFRTTCYACAWVFI